MAVVQKHHLDATQILDQMQVENFLFFFFFLKKAWFHLYCCVWPFLTSLTSFLDKYLGGKTVSSNLNQWKYAWFPCVLPQHCIFFIFLFLSEKRRFFSCTLQTSGPTIESTLKLKRKKWHFNGVLSEPLQFSMLSYSNSHHLLWANNSISNLLTHLEGIRCDIWIFRPFYKLCYRRNIQLRKDNSGSVLWELQPLLPKETVDCKWAAVHCGSSHADRLPMSALISAEWLAITDVISGRIQMNNI